MNDLFKHFDHTLFGAAYYDEYMPYDRIDTDFSLMKEAGINVIRIAESTWSTWEPSDNVYDFTHLYKMLDMASKYNLKVIIGTPTYAVPSWLVKKHPEIMSTTNDGLAIYGHRQIHDITNPKFLYYAERIIRKLMEQVSNQPNVIGYQIDNETRSGADASERTQKLFIEDMKKKYPDIKKFNDEFGLNYWSNRIDSWDDMPDIRGTINGSLSAAFKAWHRDQITKYQKWQADIISEYKRPEQFITHNYDFSWKGYSHGIQPLVNQRDAANAADIAGVDIYHLTRNLFDGATISFGGDIGRSMKKDNYLVLETQSQGRLDWLPYPGQLRQAYYSHLASGANGIMYWNWHSIHNSFESFWKGILSHDLIPGETYKELSLTRNEALKIDEQLFGLKKNNKIAILVDNRSLVGLDEFPISDISNKDIKNTETPWEDLSTNPENLDYNHILRYFYDTFYKMNLETDIIYKEDVEEWTTDELREKYSLIVVPALYSATDTTITSLRSYVSAGGHLLISFKSFFSDEELKIYHDAQPHGMTDLLGATYDQFTRPENSEINMAGMTYRIAHWMELLRPNSDKDTSVWATYTDKHWNKYAAVVHKKYDPSNNVPTGYESDIMDEDHPGSATYIGCFMEPAGLRHIINRLIDIIGIEKPYYEFPIIIKEGINTFKDKIIYIFNYSDDYNEVRFLLHSGKELLSDKKLERGDRLILKPWDVKILNVKE